MNNRKVSLKYFRVSKIFPLMLIIVFLFIVGRTYKKKKIAEKNEASYKEIYRVFLKPDLFYPDDDVAVAVKLPEIIKNYKKLFPEMDAVVTADFGVLKTKPAGIIIPLVSSREQLKAIFKCIKTAAGFVYKEVVCISAPEQGDFYDMSLFSGNSYSLKNENVYTSREIFREDLLKYKVFSYHPVFFYRGRQFATILPFLKFYKLDQKLSFVLLGTINNGEQIKKYFEDKMGRNTLLIFTHGSNNRRGCSQELVRHLNKYLTKPLKIVAPHKDQAASFLVR